MSKEKKKKMLVLALLPMLTILSMSVLALAVSSITINVDPTSSEPFLKGGEGSITMSGATPNPVPQSADVNFGSTISWWWGWYVFNKVDVDITFNDTVTGDQYKVSITVYDPLGAPITWGEAVLTGSGNKVTGTIPLNVPVTVFDLTRPGANIDLIVVPS